MSVLQVPNGREAIQQRMRRGQETLAQEFARTPIIALPDMEGQVLAKLETTQPTSSFKVNGSYLKVQELKNQGLTEVVTASTGNHAAGVIYSAKKLSMSATIFMAENASPTKRQRIEATGAQIQNGGKTFNDALSSAVAYASESINRGFAHPYDDPTVIAGNAKVFLEIMQDHPDALNWIVPVGGGGLIAAATLVRDLYAPRYLGRHRYPRIYGVQPENVAAMKASFDAGKMLKTLAKQTLADGTAVAEPTSELTFKLIMNGVEDILTVSEEQIEVAIASFFFQTGVQIEGAGALAVAAAQNNRFPGKTIIVVSGGNIEPAVFAGIIAKYRQKHIFDLAR